MDPLRFVFGVHFHQPVGNFDHVFEQHVRDVYRPLLERLAEREFFPIALHISGPLLEWLEAHETALLDRIGGLAGDGRLELLLSGLYEPVLASLPREDRVEQIRWMREAVERRFGAKAHGGGLWLTERVWEPELAADLAQAGVRYAFVDDRHFLVTGFAADRLHAPFWTESDGKRVALFPIDERLRYLIPFQPPADIAAYLRLLRERGAPLAVFVDDGEKFGGWPGTKEWVYERGWLAQFLDAMGALVASGEIRLTTPATALAEVPSGGLAYLPTASYREMEGWALPPDAALRLARLRRRVGTGGALAEFPRALSRSEPNAQEDAGAVGVVPALGGSGGGAPGDRPRAVQRRVLARRVRRAVLAASAARCLAPARAGRGRAAAGRAARRRARRPGR